MSKRDPDSKIYTYQLSNVPSDFDPSQSLWNSADLVVENRGKTTTIVKNRHGSIGPVVNANGAPHKSKGACFNIASTLSKSGTKDDMFYEVTLKHVMDNGQVAFGEGSAPVKDLAEWLALDSFRRDFAVKLTTSSCPGVVKMPVHECDQNGKRTGTVLMAEFKVPPGWGKVPTYECDVSGQLTGEVKLKDVKTDGDFAIDKFGKSIVVGCHVKISAGAFVKDARYLVDEVHASNRTVVVRYVEPGGIAIGSKRAAFISNVEVVGRVVDEHGTEIKVGCRVTVRATSFDVLGFYRVVAVDPRYVDAVTVRYINSDGSLGEKREAFTSCIEVNGDDDDVDRRVHPDDNSTVPCKNDF
jgi:hypothetical protein